jgi:hypothetical protein
VPKDDRMKIGSRVDHTISLAAGLYIDDKVLAAARAARMDGSIHLNKLVTTLMCTAGPMQNDVVSDQFSESAEVAIIDGSRVRKEQLRRLGGQLCIGVFHATTIRYGLQGKVAANKKSSLNIKSTILA